MARASRDHAPVLVIGHACLGSIFRQPGFRPQGCAEPAAANVRPLARSVRGDNRGAVRPTCGGSVYGKSEPHREQSATGAVSQAWATTRGIGVAAHHLDRLAGPRRATMRLTSYTDYTLRTLMYLAVNDGR